MNINLKLKAKNLKVLVLLFTFTLYTLTFTPVFAQQSVRSNTVTTTFGNAQPPNPGSSDLAAVLNWDIQINNALEKGSAYVGTNYNRMLADINNGGYSAVKRQGIFSEGPEITGPRGLYWCTNSVIDSYNLSGKTGLGPAQQSVVVMRNFWKSRSDYKYVEYYATGDKQAALNAAAPGYAIFFELSPGNSTGREHVAIIKEINLDARGNGFLDTYDSNSTAKQNHYPVQGWNIRNTSYPTMGFGGI